MKNKINSLTDDQKNLLQKYIEDGLKYGRSIKPINHSKCEEIICKFYELIGKEKPRFLYFSSPLICILAYGFLSKSSNIKNKKNQLRNQLWIQLGNQLRNQLGIQLENQLGIQLENQLENQLWNQLRNQLRNQLGIQLENQLRNQLENQLENQLWNQLRNQLGNQLRNQLGNQLGNQLWIQLGNQLRNQLENQFEGQQWLYWSFFYDYCAKIGVEYSEENKKLLELWMEEGKNLHWWFPYENIVLISERPIRLTVNSNGQLHNENKKAIEYSDGWGFYYLNGIKMEEEHIKTEAENLDIAKVLKEANVDVRRELIRKIGIELMLSKLPHKILDKKDDYELISVDIPDLLQDAHYLKMLNPSIGIWHLEGVEKFCKTVQDALNWRAGDLIEKGENWEPFQLT